MRLGRDEEVGATTLDEEARHRNISVFKVFDPVLADARMQNMVMLAVIAGNDLVSGVGPDDYRQAMEDLMTGTMLYRNQALFERNLDGTDPT